MRPSYDALPSVERITEQRSDRVKQDKGTGDERMDDADSRGYANEWQQRELVDKRIKPNADPQIDRTSDDAGISHGFRHLPVDDVEATRLNNDEEAIERAREIEHIGANPEDWETPERNPVGR